MTEFIRGERLSMAEVARELQVHITTVWRWASKGVRGRRLGTVAVGGRRFVLRRQLDEFLAVTPADASLDRNRRADAAGELLESMGLRKKARLSGDASSGEE